MEKPVVPKTITNKESLKREGDMNPVRSLYLFPVLCLTAIFFINFVSRIILSPMITAVESDLGLSHGEAGAIFLFTTAGYFISLIGSGYVNSRMTHRTMIILSSLFIGLVMVGISFTRSSCGLNMGMFLVGIGAGVYLPSGIATITQLVDTRQWGKVLAIHELAPNLAFLSAPFVAEVLFLWFSWRGVVTSIGVIAFIIGIVYALSGRGGEFTGETPNYGSVTGLFRNPSYVMMIFLFSLGIASSIGLFTMLPLYLVDRCGFARTYANTIVGLSRIFPLAIVLIGGWTVDRFGSIRTIQWVFLITGTMTFLLGVVPPHIISVVVFLQPIVAVWFFPAGFALLSSIVPERSRSLAVSFATPIAFLVGGGLVPTGIGAMADSGLFALAISLVGVFLLSGGLLLFIVKKP